MDEPFELFLSFFKADLNGLKQLTSKSCKAWEVWDGKVIIFSPISYAYLIASKVTCDICPSRIKRCIFYWDKISITNWIKKKKKNA
jgi:hypothetical protein